MSYSDLHLKFGGRPSSIISRWVEFNACVTS